MTPTAGEISIVAYERWERRGRAHGFDRADWLAAERSVRFARTYRVVVADRLDAKSPRMIGNSGRRRCRFCGQAEPRTTFAGPGCPVFPAFLGVGGPVAFDQCEDCRALFAEEIDLAFERFLRPIGHGCNPENPGIAVDAFKGILKLAIALMPSGDAEMQEDAIEWISNLDHSLDLNAFRGYSCVVHHSPTAFPATWTALASRVEADESLPQTLFFLGIRNVILQITVPSDTLEDGGIIAPDVLPPSPFFGAGSDPVSRILRPIVACELRMSRT